jgi:hypothetical protein
MRLARTVSALASQQLRVHFLCSELSRMDIYAAAETLEALGTLAHEGSERARVALVALTGMLHEPSADGLVLALRLAARQRGPASPLWRLLGAELDGPPGACEPDDQARVPDYGMGRPLALGERKALARKPTRALLDKLLGDPDPTVIQVLLSNPMTTEDDVVRLGARRPLRPEVIEQLLRHPRWNVSKRVRMALVLNPSTPAALGLPLVALLLRSELRTTVNGSETNEQLRAAAAERLARGKHPER